MTDAYRSASFGGRTGAAAVHKCLPFLMTQKRYARFSACNSAISESRSSADTRLEAQRMEAFEEMVVASRSKLKVSLP
jgi:hypothetical protein